MGVKGDPGGGVTSSGPSASGPSKEPSQPAASGPEAEAPETGASKAAAFKTAAFKAAAFNAAAFKAVAFKAAAFNAAAFKAAAFRAAAFRGAASKTAASKTAASKVGEPETKAAAPEATAGGLVTVAGPAAKRPRPFLALLRTHWLFVLILIPAIAFRVIAELGFRWALWFNDSYGYVADATGTFKPDTLRPSGYSVFLRFLEPLHSFATPVILQHLMGLGIGVMVYALAVHRFRVPKAIAALATIPALFDGNQIQLEHLLLSDVPFAFLVTAAATIVLWRKKPSTLQFALAGGLLGLASVTRTAGLPLLAVLAVFMLIHRAGWKAITSMVVACLIPLGGYMLWFFAFYGDFNTTQANGIFMYQRVMAFADCGKMTLAPEETALCDTTPPSKRPISQWYMWGKTTPLLRFPPPRFGPLQNRLGEKFAITAIESQPLAYANLIWHDTDRAFWWSRPVFPDPLTYAEYRFSNAINGPSRKAALGVGYSSSQPRKYTAGATTTQVVQPYAGIMIWYQKHIWMPGTPLGALLIVGLCGMAVGWRRWGGEVLLPWGVSVGLLLIPAATAEFDYRYVLPAVPFACLAAAIIFGEGNPVGDRLLARLDRRRAARAIPAVPKELAAVDRVPSPPPASTSAGDAAGPQDTPDGGQDVTRSGAQRDGEADGEQDGDTELRPDSESARSPD